MWKILFPIRYISLIAVITAFIGSFFMFCIGAKKAFVAIWDYLNGIRPNFIPDHMMAEDIVFGRFIIVLDSFLLAIILMYFGYAIYALLIIKDEEVEKSEFPDWLLPSSVGDLKETLSQVIIVLMFVLALRIIWLGLDKLVWEMLIVPVSIVLLAVALRVVGFKNRHK